MMKRGDHARDRIAQHGDVVADADQLFEPVGNVDHRPAIRREAADGREKLLDFRRRQRGIQAARSRTMDVWAIRARRTN